MLPIIVTGHHHLQFCRRATSVAAELITPEMPWGMMAVAVICAAVVGLSTGYGVKAYSKMKAK